MLPIHEKWTVLPSIVRANATNTLTIAPIERSFLFYEGTTYTVKITGSEADEPFYHTPVTPKILNVVAHGGVLTFSFDFEGEQEYLIQLKLENQKLALFSVYALNEDLYRLRPLRGDLHSHSFRSDGVCDAAALAGYYREQGYDFLALTDHNRYFSGEEIDETYRGVKMGLLRVPGEEVHTPDTQVHIIHVGGKSSVCARYVQDDDTYRREIEECFGRVPDSVPERYRHRYAQVIWVSEHIRAAGGLVIFPHPYWRPGATAGVFNVNTEFARILLTSGLFDAYELIGGMHPEDNNLSLALWQEISAAGHPISVVGSSDEHNVERSDTFPHYFTVCFATENTTEGVLAAVRGGLSVAVEAFGTDYDRRYHVYGAHRLVAYTQFLLHHYFNHRRYICYGEGLAMRAYTMGDTPAASIEMQADVAELYYRRFFGLEAPLLPSPEIVDFVAKSRARQLDGPTGRGSIFNPEVPTRNI